MRLIDADALINELVNSCNNDQTKMFPVWIEKQIDAQPTVVMLKEQEAKQYSSHEVACIIADLFGDSCACNFCDIDTWLPYKCDFIGNWCPHPPGAGCWEQYLKHREGR